MVTLQAITKILFDKPASGLWDLFVEHLSGTLAGQQSVTQYIAMIAMILVTLKAAAKNKLLYDKQASVCSTSEWDLSWTTKCDPIHSNGCSMILVTLKATAKHKLLYDKQAPEAGLLNI